MPSGVVAYIKIGLMAKKAKKLINIIIIGIIVDTFGLLNIRENPTENVLKKKMIINEYRKCRLKKGIKSKNGCLRKVIKHTSPTSRAQITNP